MNGERRKFSKKKTTKLKELCILVGLAFLLVFAVWKIFYRTEENTQTTAILGTEAERALSKLLSEIEGVGEVSVMICETEEGVQSVVIVCEGAKNIRVNSDVREAAAAALGTTENNVKIYVKKD